MRNLLLTSGAVAAGLTAAASIANGQEKRPNIIYVLADQLRADVLGYNGDKNAITPNFDRFAAESMNFSNAISVCPVSAAHRASLFTGKYVSSTGMIINEINMNPNHRTVAHVLSDAGYDLGYVGKVHLNDGYRRPYKKGPERMGFDGYWAAYTFNHMSYSSYYFTDDENGDEKFVDLKGQYGPEVFTGLALDYIEKEAAADNPFMLVLSWNPPHDPWDQGNVVPECYEKFKDKEFKLPENFKETPDQYMDRYPGGYLNGKESWKEEFIHGGGYQETMRCYYAMVNSLDGQFGRILDKIEELGIGDNTIVVFTSDHGEMFTSQGRMYKLTFYEEACHIPFLVRWPKSGIKGESDICLNTPDIAPTLIGMAGVPEMIPEEMEGSDLSYVFRGEKSKGRAPEYAFMQGMGHTHLWKDGFEWRAVRDERYTYATYLRDSSELLFDRKLDPYEKNNVIGDKKYRSVAKMMRGRMAEKMEELNDEFKPCTWYRDHWMYKGYSIESSARGKFGPLPPVEPRRK